MTQRLFDSPSYDARYPYRERCPHCRADVLANNDGNSYLVDGVNHANGEQFEVVTFHCPECGHDFGVIQ